jgi:protein gp37
MTSADYWKQPLKWNKKAAAEGKRHLVFCGSMMDWCDEEAPEFQLLRLWSVILGTPALTWLLLTKRPERINASLPECWTLDTLKLVPNVWLGVSIEDQATADKRIPILLTIPAAKHFVSAEPLLELVNLGPYLHTFPEDGIPALSWVIAGGESGPGARPCQAEWLRHLHDECRAYDVPYFVKQLGGFPDKKHRLEDLPADLRIREFPGVGGT